MATPTIPNGEEHFFPVIYEGNGGGQKVGKFVPFTDNGTIANSCIFNDDDSAYIQRTPSSETNRDTWTLSYWVKRGAMGYKVIFQQGADQNNCVNHTFDSNDRLNYQMTNSGSYTDSLITNRTFEDTSKWYHIVLAVDTTQSTEAYRVRMYVDGDEITSWNTANYPAQNVDTDMNTTTAFRIGGQVSGSLIGFDGYLAEVNFIDGQQLTPASFGETDTSTGRWIPKTLSGITYGTNGFRLTFADSSALGDDTSGNGNDFTATNLASTDQTTDSPTQNHCIMDSNITAGSPTLAEGNTKITGPSSDYGKSLGTLAFDASTSTGYYWEVTFTNSNTEIGIMNNQKRPTASNSSDVGATILQARGGGGGNTWWFNQDDVELADTGVTHSSSHRIQVAVKNGNIWFGYNNTWFLSGNPSTGANPAFTGLEARGLQRPYFAVYDAISMTIHMNDDDWSYTPPTGFVALQQDNMQATDKGTSGLVWIKDRDSTYFHVLYDSSRGPRTFLYPNGDQVEQGPNGPYPQLVDGVQKFLKGGFSIEDQVNLNTSGNSYVSWNWVANGGTTSTNEDGSITTTTQVNSTAGFSIIQYTGTEAAATIGHGLSQTPDFILIKSLETHSPNGYWVVWHKDFAANTFQYFNTNIANDTSTTFFNNTLPTSSVINLGANFNTNMSGDKMICYAWHEVDGYSKFGSYSGNNSTDGPFIYTGFRPAFIMVKKTNATASWTMQDTTRDSINPSDKVLQTDLADAEVTGFLEIDFLSNGFKFRSADNQHNASGGSYIYFAFAEHPFVGDGTSPVTAR